MRRHEIGDLARRALLRLEGEGNVRPVEAVHEDFRLRVEQPPHDVDPRHRVGGRRQREEGRAAKLPAERTELQVVGAEIVSPLRDAMRFVDGEPRQPDLGQPRLEAGRGEPLGRCIEEAELAGCGAVERCHVVLVRIRGGERRRGDAERPHRRHLVAHQRNQRRHDERQPAFHHRRKLIAERFPRTRRHDSEHIGARHDRRDDLVLSEPERGEAEGVVQRGAEGVCVQPSSSKRGRAPRMRVILGLDPRTQKRRAIDPGFSGLHFAPPGNDNALA